jgi:hypothetical protein
MKICFLTSISGVFITNQVTQLLIKRYNFWLIDITLGILYGPASLWVYSITNSFESGLTKLAYDLLGYNSPLGLHYLKHHYWW